MSAIRYIHIADNLSGHVPKKAIIHIVTPLPITTGMEMHQIDAIYEKDAEIICEALFESLPQGTRVRLARRMMEKEIQGHGFYRGI